MTHFDEFAVPLARGVAAASAAIDELSGGRISIATRDVRRSSPADVVSELGPPDDTSVGVYVGFDGPTSGHALLLMSLDSAARVGRHLLGDLVPPGADGTDGAEDVAASALEELGNVVISAILNELGRGGDAPIYPSVPQAVTEMTGAILDALLADLVAESDEVTVARSVFTEDGDTFDGWLLVLPRPTVDAAPVAPADAA